MSVRTERHGPVGILTLDRPEKANAYDRAHIELLERAFAELTRDARVVVVQTGGDRAFCGGADLDEMSDVEPVSALDLQSQRVFTGIARSPAVSIAAVQGAAIAGGFELALACDLRVVGPRAVFRLPETALGLVPSAGGTTRLARLAGASVARQVILAGRELDADRAVALGLAIGVAEDPRAEAVRVAGEVARRDPLALRLAKEILEREGEEAGLAAERYAEAILYGRRKARG